MWKESSKTNMKEASVWKSERNDYLEIGKGSREASGTRFMLVDKGSGISCFPTLPRNGRSGLASISLGWSTG